jgi:uncharacterized membrane protein YphA (DoxX/SURF4 family)
MVTPLHLWRAGIGHDHRAKIVLAIRVLVAVIWFVLGTVFKVMGVVPRHREIVAHVLGPEIAQLVTVLIGVAETALGIWFLMGFFPRVCATLQTAAIAGMNTLELTYARSLLLAPVPMIILNSVLLALVWYAASYRVTKNCNVISS